jgi:type 1 glutamine amidotransferase
MGKIAALLLMGGPEYHNHTFHYAELAGLIAGEGGIDLRITDDLDILRPDVLSKLDVVINWSTHVEPTDAQSHALVDAVGRGDTNLAGLHGGNATFWNSAGYLKMVGSRLLRHGPYKRFTVHIENGPHPITEGTADFEVEDELYENAGDVTMFDTFAAAYRDRRPSEEYQDLGEGPLSTDISVLASAEDHPLVYVKSFGAGRVYYNALGHDEKALRNPDYRRLALRGVIWAAGRLS